MELTPSQRALVRRRTRRPEVDPADAGGELNVIPFLDIVVNLIMFLLVTSASVVAISQVEAQLPSHGPACRGGQCAKQGLELSVTLTEAGIVVAGSGGMLAPGCDAIGPASAPTVPLGAESYDFDALGACAARVKDRYPGETEVVLGADPTVEYENVIRAMDALRSRDGALLFPDVLVSAGVR